jgi:hypothetical protein
MCTSTATLLYDLWVTTASLAIAASAHHRTRSPFLAIDLILLRRRSGKLKVRRGRRSRALARIPPEGWEHIKQRLVLMEARNAELEAIAPMRCRQCLKEDVVVSLLDSIRLQPQATSMTFGIKHKWDYWGLPECEACWDNAFEGDIDFFTAEALEVSAREKRSSLNSF